MPEVPNRSGDIVGDPFSSVGFGSRSALRLSLVGCQVLGASGRLCSAFTRSFLIRASPLAPYPLARNHSRP